MSGKKCVYRHISVSDGNVFYVGIGTIGRAYSRFNRSKKWRDFIEKNEYYVDIIFQNLEWEEACDLEMLIIKMYGRLDKNLGGLLNMSDGGKEMLGIFLAKNSKETKASK